MKGIFVESLLFENHRQKYLNDKEFLCLQNKLLASHKVDPVIQDAGGLRMDIIAAKGRGKGSGA